MKTMEIDKILENNVRFTKRSVAVPIGARLSYRVAQICLILDFSCEKRESCSIQKIQTISNALLKKNEFEKLLFFVKHRNYLMSFSPRIDPCVNSSVEFAIKYGLCARIKTGRKVKLTALGKSYVKKIKCEEVLLKEINMLSRLGTELTEEIIEGMWL